MLVAVAVVVVLAVGAVTTLAVTGDDQPVRAGLGRAAGPLGDVTGTGAPAPDFELRTLEGATVRLSDFHGRPVVVNFWASWCKPCKREFPLLRRALAKHEPDDLVVVGVSFRELLVGDARAFAEQQRPSWPLLWDPGGAVAKAWGVRSIPHSFFVARDGTLVSQLFGETDRGTLARTIDQIVAS